ncbi:MAG: pantoate--beta-alanine ligase [Candidatus Aminicenantes bacterium]|nr:MAG: pantoate--beta-alanine ligase [Candidatus Aminicenantes bacterium]
MKTLKTVDKLREELKKYKSAGHTLGFVPTMGYLHQGHLSLVRQSKKENDVTVVSIFVNPAQFAPDEDFDQYPRALARDEQLLQELNVDVVFYPAKEEIYPGDYATYVEVEKLSKVLCGKSRPTHFRGVATVVLKLLNIVSPTRAYFGRKDAQQAIIIKKMVKDLHLDAAIHTVPIVRDPDGLALSSRNAYLSAEERKAALCLSQALKKAKSAIDNGLRDSLAVKDILQKEASKHPLVKIDYLEVVSLDDLEKVKTIDITNTLVAGAIRVGKTRLIDNFILGEI